MLASAVIAFVFFLIIIFGSFSNGLIVYTYWKWRNTMLSQAKDVLILSLAIGDFLSTVLASPLGLSSAISQRWLWGQAGCVWYAFITTWVGLASIIQLAILVIERLITLRSPTPNIVTMKQIFQAVLVSWLLAFLTCCFPLFGWSKYTFEGLGLHCSILWDTRSTGNLSFCLFLLILFYFTPLVAILGSYVKIILIVRLLYKNADKTWGRDAQATKQVYTAQVKTTKQMICVVVGFLVAWTPYAVMTTMILLLDEEISLEIQEFPSMFAKTAVLYNPIIYFFTNRKLRKRMTAIVNFSDNVVRAFSS